MLTLVAKELREKKYQQYIEEGIDEETLNFYQDKKKNCILGSKDFIRQITKNYLIENQLIKKFPN